MNIYLVYKSLAYLQRNTISLADLLDFLFQWWSEQLRRMRHIDLTVHVNKFENTSCFVPRDDLFPGSNRPLLVTWIISRHLHTQGAGVRSVSYNHGEFSGLPGDWRRVDFRENGGNFGRKNSNIFYFGPSVALRLHYYFPDKTGWRLHRQLSQIR